MKSARLGLLLLTLLLSIGVAGWGDLYNETDGQYGGAAKVMAKGGSWLIPENNGIPRLVKPPLLYWLVAGSMTVFGQNEFAARLPGALSLAAWVFLTYLIGRRIGSERLGLMAAAILLTCLGCFTLGRIVMPEPTFAVLIAAAVYCVLAARDQPSRRKLWSLGFWLCAALASFVKGWHGLIYPLAIIGAVALCDRSFRPSARHMISWTGPLIFLALNLPWYLYVERQFPGYFHNLFTVEHVGHMVGHDSPATGYTDVPRLQFLLLHLAWFFPWSILALVTWLGFRKSQMDSGFKLIAAWILVILGSALLAGQRQDYYAMTMWPAFALGAARILEHRRPTVGLALVTVILSLAFLASLAIPFLPTATSSGTVAERATAWTTLTNFDASVWQSLSWTAWLALGGALIALGFALSWKDDRSFIATVLAAACLSLGAISGMAIVAPYFSSAQLAPALGGVEEIIYDGDIDTGSSLLFYTDARLSLLDIPPDKDFIVRKFRVGRDRFITTDELVARWHTAEPVTMVTESRRLNEWRILLSDSDLTPVARSGTQIILRSGR